ncbi:hypothetical protein LAZ67_13003150 [Cordylochernes scorpioides]|uniref:Uncharacterized protein n=1 Tax=Cordylochernes scorpioides TaxID=51811 RepID=A0ABY6L545_9ARAC|nr:hypothetical protein LAZ67_13003150 [Cordylochernes scorpioides]
MKLRMLRHSFKIKYIPRKENIIGNEELQEEISAFTQNMELHSDVSDKWIKEIANHQNIYPDPLIQQVKNRCLKSIAK